MDSTREGTSERVRGKGNHTALRWEGEGGELGPTLRCGVILTILDEEGEKKKKESQRTSFYEQERARSWARDGTRDKRKQKRRGKKSTWG